MKLPQNCFMQILKPPEVDEYIYLGFVIHFLFIMCINNKSLNLVYFLSFFFLP